MKCNSPRLLFCTILLPNHISALFSQGHRTSLSGTELQSGVDGGCPAEVAVRCNKLMVNLRRCCCCCQPGRGGSCSLPLTAQHINVPWKLVSGITETMFTSSDFSWKVKHGWKAKQRPAVGEAPADLSQQRLSSALNDFSRSTGGKKPLDTTCTV